MRKPRSTPERQRGTGPAACLLAALGLVLLSAPFFASNPEPGKSRGPRLLRVHASCGDCQLNVGESLEIELVATYADGSVGPPRSFGIRPSVLHMVTITGRKVTALRGGDVSLNISVWDGWGGAPADETSLRLHLLNPGDSDMDSLPDSWELENGFNPNYPLDRNRDPDEDGLANHRELKAGTNPHIDDTDGDGRMDGWEVDHDHTDPTVADADPNAPSGIPLEKGKGVLERRDQAPPTVAIVEPDGPLPNRRPYKIAINAADDLRVSKVELWARGRLVGMDTKAPFLIPIVPNLDAPNFDDPLLEIYAVAFDGEAGNRVESARAWVKILPDQRPDVRFLGSKNITVMEDSSFEVMLAATDDHKILSIEALQDGSLVGTGSNTLSRFELRAPVGRPWTILDAQAVDDIGQVTSTQWRLQVIPDPPPTIAFLSPVAGTGGRAEALAGSHLQVRLAATDNRRLQFVELKVAGVSAGRLKAPPFDWIVFSPLGPSSLALEAIAFDDLGKSAAASWTVNLLPTATTGVTGQVVDSLGNPQVGATVRCNGVSATTTLDGSFLISAVPAKGLGASCSAVAGLPPLVGTSGHVPFAPGTTDVGVLVVGATLAIFGRGSPAETFVSDENLTGSIPWSGDLDGNVTGLAFAADGTVWQAETDARGGGRSPSFRLLSRRDPVTLEPIQGPVTVFEVGAGAEEVALIDLAVDLRTSQLYGLDHDFFAGGHRLLRIDQETGRATQVGELPPYFSAGLDFDGAGRLWVVSEKGGAWQLHLVDAQTGEVLSSSTLSRSGTVAAVAWNPARDDLMVASGDSFYLVIPGSASATHWSSPKAALGSGELTSLAIRRSAGAAATTTLTGTVVDAFGEPISGAVVRVPGRWALSAADGSFILTDVLPRTGRVRVAATIAGKSGYSTALAPRLGGTTSVGSITIQVGGGGLQPPP